MRHFLRAALLGGAFTLLLCVTSAQAQPNLLTNPTLDATAVSSQLLPTPTSWTVAASRANLGVFNDGASSENFAGNPPTPDTDNVGTPGTDEDFGLFVKGFQGTTAAGDMDVDMTQVVGGITPGTTYFMRGWAGAGAGYSGLIAGSRTQSLFAMDFLTAGDALISSAVLDLRAAGLGNNPPQPFGYRQYSLSAVAPANTAKIRVRVSVVDAFANSGDQAFVVDDFSLSVPEPASFGLISLGGIALAARRRRAA